MFWNHKVLPCVVEKCSKYLTYFIWVSSLHKKNLVLSSLRRILLLVQPCNNPDCWYLHDFGSQEDSFTKDGLVSAFERYIKGAISHAFCAFEICIKCCFFFLLFGQSHL